MYPDKTREEEMMKATASKVAVEQADTKLPLWSQEKAIAELQDTIHILESRLQPILTPSYNEIGAATESQPAPIQSPLADKLEDNNQSIFSATSKLRYIIDRIEC